MKTLDPVNAKIIEALGKNDPRNLLALAKKIGLPPTTVTFRIKKLMKEDFLKIKAKINSHKLGLMKAVLIAATNRGHIEALLKAVENAGYWTYTAHCYGRFNGVYAVFSFPFEYKAALEEYLEKARQLGVISNYVLLWTTNIFEVAPNFTWFDFKRKAWNFAWNEWQNEILTSSSELPERLIDPKSYEIEVDYIDLLILKELEKDGLQDFTELAKVTKITPQAVRHRFLQHVLRRNLVTEYEVAIFPYPLQVSDLCAFVFDFADEKAMAKFANSLIDKPFVINRAKVIGKNSLVVHFYIPKVEFSHFVELLNRLAVEGIIEDFFYVSLDVGSFKRQTVSYEFFNNGQWTYEASGTVDKLTRIMPIQLKAKTP
ncbi:MAG TPA: winged helix-turn-helix transcriptional regulator [Candidatus Bathyarchaeia archaeon]|nr:winged helix-turn-helix transcriptional regulator [Candidatus Bathyarchaeia archaeon]